MRIFGSALMVAALSFECGAVQAKDVNPPPEGSFCYKVMAEYIGEAKPNQYLRIGVRPDENRDGTARFNISYKTAVQLRKDPNDPESLMFSLGGVEPRKISSVLLQSARDYGSWAVVLPTQNGNAWSVQVFVASPKGCDTVYKKDLPVLNKEDLSPDLLG